MKNRLSQLRREKRLTQDQLASEMGVSRQTISSLEKGRYNPSIELALKLGKFFQMPVEYIFILEEENK